MMKVIGPLKKVVATRWFPSATLPIALGALASAISYGLGKVGITAFPSDVQNAITPALGLLVAAIAQRPLSRAALGVVNVKTTVAAHTATYEPAETLGQTIAQTFLSDVAKQIDADPSLLQHLAATALERVLNPVVTVPGQTDHLPQT